MHDLFQAEQEPTPASIDYSAKDIEVLEGLEPVRRRPGMFIGGTDERALHHLVAELLDNAMDEAVAGHADWIELRMDAEGGVTVKDNGRGIPTDPHPKFPDKSALEVILTTLHSGGKFSNKAYQTAGGLHGVGVSVVNALSEELVVEVARNKTLWRQLYVRGKPETPLTEVGSAANRRGTLVTFKPDPEIFGKSAEIQAGAPAPHGQEQGIPFPRRRDPLVLRSRPSGQGGRRSGKGCLPFPEGPRRFSARHALRARLRDRDGVQPVRRRWRTARAGWSGRSPGPRMRNPTPAIYCNTVPTPQGGSHEQAVRGAMIRALRSFGELTGQNAKKMGQVTADDLLSSACVLLSLFIPDPQFQGQTKDKLLAPEAGKLVEQVLKDRFDHWLSAQPEAGRALLDYVINRADERLARRKAKDVARKTATRKLRLARQARGLFGGRARGHGDLPGGGRQRRRFRQAGTRSGNPGDPAATRKILNAASATADKLRGNKELSDLLTALGCGTGRHYKDEDLRYDKVVIMTDADVDGAHIAALLMTYFYREMKGLIDNGHLYLAQPPLCSG